MARVPKAKKPPRKRRSGRKAGLFFDRAVVSDHGGEKDEDYVDYDWVKANKAKIEEYFTRTFDFFPAGWKFYEHVDQQFTEDCFSIDAGVHADVAETKRVITGNFKRLCFYHAVLGLGLMLGLAFASSIASRIATFIQ